MNSIGNIMTHKRHCLFCSIVVWDSQGQIRLPMSWGEGGGFLRALPFPSQIKQTATL